MNAGTDKNNFPIPWITPSLPQEFVEVFRRNGVSKIYKKDAILIDENHEMDYFLYIKHGVISQAVVNFNLNKPLAMNIFTDGRMMGYLNFFTKLNSPRRITCLKKSEILIITFDEMNSIIDSDFKLYKSFVAYCELCGRSELNGMIGLFTSSAEDRLRVLYTSILCSAGYDFKRCDERDWVKLPFSLRRDDIIKIIYTSKLTLDRILAQWTKDGLTRREGKDIFVRPQNLKSIRDWMEHI